MAKLTAAHAKAVSGMEWQNGKQDTDDETSWQEEYNNDDDEDYSDEYLEDEYEEENEERRNQRELTSLLLPC